MSPLTVHVKHAGKVHDVQLDPDQPASVFKDAVYQVTGVPLERMKVMIKGGILKAGIHTMLAFDTDTNIFLVCVG
jgi:ubiquitin carboxyl-terminal hydrolase 14